MAARLSPEQRRVLDTILDVGHEERATPMELKAAVETGWVETRLRNLHHGDADSQGWRQERRSLYPDPTSVVHSARRFFKEARARRGKHGTAGSLAAAVQRPRSDLRSRYQDVSEFADQLLAGVGGSGGAVAHPQARGRAAGLVDVPGGGTDVASLLAVVLGAERPAAPEVALPSFAAGPTLPQGYRPQTPAQPQAGPSISDLLALVRTQGGDVPSLAQPGETGTAEAPRGPTSSGGVKGRVVLRAGANRAGVPISKTTMAFFERVAGHTRDGVLRVGTGTNHSRLTVNGRVSDHHDGHAGDVPVEEDSREGDMIAAHALVAAGVPWKKALAAARKGGLFNVNYKGHRVQVIWKTDVGGNHHTHVHIGFR